MLFDKEFSQCKTELEVNRLYSMLSRSVAFESRMFLLKARNKRIDTINLPTTQCLNRISEIDLEIASIGKPKDGGALRVSRLESLKFQTMQSMLNQIMWPASQDKNAPRWGRFY